MIYFICFLLSLLLLIWVIGYGKITDNNMIMLIIVVVIGNGGFCALAYADSLSEALLANKICYCIGIFAPVTLFHVFRNICRIDIPRPVYFVTYLIQFAEYLGVLTISRNTLFYKTVEFHEGPPAFLTKTYGPLHTAYLISVIAYTLLNLIMGFVSLERKTIVSRNNITILVFVNMLVVAVYIIERLTYIEYELIRSST